MKYPKYHCPISRQTYIAVRRDATLTAYCFHCRVILNADGSHPKVKWDLSDAPRRLEVR